MTKSGSQANQSKLILLFASILVLIVGVLGLVFSLPAAPSKFPLTSPTTESSDAPSFVDISIDEYDSLISDKKSFLLFVDQAGCITADGLESLAKTLMEERHVSIYRILYSDMRKTTLFEKVKYYPSFVLIDSGTPVSWLRADSDEDIDRYKDYKAFTSWLDTYIDW